MDNWNVFVVIGAVFAFLVSVVTPIIKLNTTIVKLAQIVDRMANDLSQLTEKNTDTHQKLFDRLENHEHRIIKLETMEEYEK